MNLHTLKISLIALIISCVIPAVQAQFDDVYYNPDDYVPRAYKNSTGEARYIDNEANASYYSDYDYYYSSRIKRFYRPSYASGFGFYDPYFVDAHYYDPFYSQSDYYPGANIYYSYGSSGCGGNSTGYYPGSNWGHSPSIQSIGNNIWYAPSSNFWGISDGCESYVDYYNTYYNSCPSPVTHYYGITTVYIDHTGGRGSYYGPRITGTAGTSPRGPLFNNNPVQPVYESGHRDLTQSNGTPKESGPTINPIRSNPSAAIWPGVEKAPEVASADKAENPSSVGKEIPVDVELNKNENRPGSNRPVFRPDAEKFKPTNENVKAAPDNPKADHPNSDITPERGSSRPSFQPHPGEVSERPRYTPPQRNPAPSGNDNRPSSDKPNYSAPLERIFDSGSRSNDKPDKPSYSPPERNNDSGRSNDRPSYSPSRDNSSGGSSSRPDSGRSSSPSPSSGGSGSPRSGRG